MKILNVIILVIIALIVTIFYHFVFQNAVNVPYFDDYSYLNYVVKLIDSPNLWTFLRELEFKHNGHGVITAKLVFWFDYLLTGRINFRVLILVGSLLIICLFGYFVKVLKTNHLPFYYSLPVALLLFTPAYHEDIFWAAALWQYTASFVVGLLSYYLLAKSNKIAFIGAIFTGFLLTYTNGNGLFGMYVGVLIPLLQHRYLKASIWTLVCLLTTVVFYWHYPFGFGSLEDDKNLRHSLVTLMAFLGACAHYLRGRSLEIALLGGGIALTFLGLMLAVGKVYCKALLTKTPPAKWFQRLSASPENLSLLTLISWLSVTALGVIITRTSTHLETPVRYMIYSIIAFLAAYLLALIVLRPFWQKIIGILTCVFGIVFYVGTYLFAGPIVNNFSDSLRADTFSLRHHRRVSGKIETMTDPRTQRNLEEAIRRGIYELPAEVVSLQELAQIDTTRLQPLPMEMSLDTLPAYGGILIHKVHNQTLSLNNTKPKNANFLILRSDSTVYLIAANQRASRKRMSFLKSKTYFKRGFETLIFQQNVAPGQYRLGILRLENDQKQGFYTPTTIQIRDFSK